ncbi:S8 family serine peptidase [Heyndrickxia sporothermodurans]
MKHERGLDMILFKKSWSSRVVKCFVTVSLIIGLIVTPIIAADASSKSEQILASLSKEQRDALQKLQVTENTGLQGFSEKELKSDKELSVIVEFKSKPVKVATLEAILKKQNLTEKKAKKKIEKEHIAFTNDLKTIIPSSKMKNSKAPYHIMHSFHTIYNGVSIKLPANKVELLLHSDVVKAVYKSRSYSIEPPANTTTSDEQESTKRVESIPFLGVDKLHKEGITGKGVKVGVIDTGIDYNHPDLKDAYKGGYDLVDNDDDPMETTYDDWKKSGRPEFDGNLSSYYTEHGTHVSGTIAGKAKNTGGVAVKGIAPDVDLYVYRVLGPYGSGELGTILAGIEKAVEDGMNIINLSLGENINDPFSPISTAINYTVLNGVTAVVSSGNSGPNSYTLGSPGAAALALTVGASTTPIPIVKYTGKLNGSSTNYALSNLYSDFTTDLKVFANQTLEVVDLGNGTQDDYLNKDVKGKVVFVNTGLIGTQSKTIYAKEHGASVIIAYSNIPNGGTTPFVREDQRFIPAFSMSYEQGVEFKAQLAKGNTTLTFKNYNVEETKSDVLASFSSRGPSRKNYDIKPEVTAPGVSIFSTVPPYAVNKNDRDNYQYAYDRMSGTSMAAPHVTGIAALMLQARPPLQPSDIKRILMNTSKALNGKYSVFEVGAGRVDPYRAVHSEVKIGVNDETNLPLNGENNIISEQTGGLSFGNHYAGEKLHIEKPLTIENFSNKKKDFIVTAHFQSEINGSLDAKSNGVKVSVIPYITIQSNNSTNIPVSITVPKNANAGIYEGYLEVIDAENIKNQYRIPFSIRTTEEGFDTTSLSSYIISPTHLQVKRAYSSTSWTSLIFRLKSPMKKIDVVLVDGRTGDDLGFIATIATESLNDGQSYSVQNVFEGTYYSFTNNPDHPISLKKSYVSPGLYRIKLIGTGERNHIFTTSHDIYIDHSSPTITTSLDNQDSSVIEYQPGQKSNPIQVKVIDEEIDLMKAAGMDVSQASNSLDYSIDGSYNPTLPLNKDGTLDFQVPINEASPFMNLTLTGLDGAKNSTEKKKYYFVKSGTPYGYTTSDKKNVKMGETVTATLHLNNVEKLKTAVWEINNQFDILEAKPNDTLKEYGIAKVDLETKGSTSVVKLAMDQSKEIKGNISVIDLTLKVRDSSFIVSSAINPTNVSYTNELGQVISLYSAGKEWAVQPTFSEVYGTLYAEGIGYNANWTKLGASIKLLDTNNNMYDGTNTLVSYGEYQISNLPITNKQFTWELKLPGHFTMKRKIPVGVEKKGILFGQLFQYFSEKAIAGDANQDDVIDIRDAIALQNAWNTNERAYDINFDGVVDEKDMKFIINNYLTQNPDSDNPPKPLEQVDGKTLEDILKELQISA